MRQVVNYQIERGELWERLVVIKDRRTHRKRVPTQATAVMTIADTKYLIPSTVSSEGGVLLTLQPGNTEWLQDGEYPWDMEVIVSRSALLTSTPLQQTIAVRGILTVSTYDNIAPLDSDGVPVALQPLGV
jgi:hypothetical protein